MHEHLYPGTINKNECSFAGPRASLLTSNACLPVGIIPISSEVPDNFVLNQNYPNPFNPSTNITFSIPKSSLVTLKVYDISGKEVSVLVNENLQSGTYNADWNASGFATGLYFYTIEADGFRQTRKMILTK